MSAFADAGDCLSGPSSRRKLHDDDARRVLARRQVHPGARPCLPVRHPGAGPPAARPASRRPARAASTRRRSSRATAARRSAGSTRRSSATRSSSPSTTSSSRPGLNEDLRRTAVFGSQMVEPLPASEVRRRARHVVRQGAGRGSHRRRIQARQLRGRRARTAACSPSPATIPSRSRRRCRATPRSRSADALMPDDLPGQRAGDPGPGPARLHALAHLRALGGDEDRHQRGRRGGHRRGRIRIACSPSSPPSSWTASRSSTQINVNLIPPYGLDMERTLHYARLELARRYAWENKLNRITVPTPDAWLGILTTRQDLLRRAPGPRTSWASTRRRCAATASASSRWGMLFPMEPRIIREFGRGLEEILVVEEKRALPRDVRQGRALRLAGPAARGRQARRGGAPAARRLVGELDSDPIARAHRPAPRAQGARSSPWRRASSTSTS